MKKINLKGAKICFDSMEIKPNFSELGRTYGCDRRTAKKMYEGIGKTMKRKRTSKLDQYEALIKEKLAIPGVNMKALYMFIKMNVNDDIGSYSNFRKYINAHDDLAPIRDKSAHVLFETEYGQQLQFDWKGPMTLHTKDNKKISFYVFSATLSASRLHVYCYSDFMIREEVERCLIETFETIGGITKEALTDNMSSIVNISEKEFTKEFKAFTKDMGFKAYHCKPDHPFTKGKDESCNRFVNWLKPYDYEIEDKEALKEIIKRIQNQANREINQTTNMPPITLFEKEKEHLNPLPRKDIIEKYLDNFIPVKVSNTSLFYYKGSRYSVPKEYIGRTLKVKEDNQKLYVYYNRELITMHDITEKTINYHREDYIDGLTSSMPDKTTDFIEELSKKNLKLFDEMNYNKKKEGKNENE